MSNNQNEELKISLESVDTTLASMNEPISAYELVPVMITTIAGRLTGLVSDTFYNKLLDSVKITYSEEMDTNWTEKAIQKALSQISELEKIAMICSLKIQRVRQKYCYPCPINYKIAYATATGLRRKKEASKLKISLESVDTTLASMNEPISAYELVPVMITVYVNIYDIGAYAHIKAYDSFRNKSLFDSEPKSSISEVFFTTEKAIQKALSQISELEKTAMICSLKIQREYEYDDYGRYFYLRAHATATGLRRKNDP